MSRLALLAVGVGAAAIAAVVYSVGPSAVAPKLAFLGQPPAAPPADPVASGQARGVAFLLKQQSDDGAWRSDVYATFKDGTALTPLVLCALQDAADSADSKAARQKASDWLAKMAKPDGTIDEGKEGIAYQVYTASLTVTALSHPENKHHTKARDAWLKYLLDRQLTEQNGWTGDDKYYGGWGYYPGVPKKPAPGQAVPAQHLLESNTSATVFALDALRAAEHTDSKRWRSAGLMFLMRLRNPDEGFRFIADDPVRNKAGVASREPEGEPVFHSYGSATADGVRAMWLWTWAMSNNSNKEWEERKKKDPNAPHPPPGLSTTPDQAGSLRWLVKHYRPDIHPGTYIPTHEPNRNAVYFYYARSVAKTLCMLSTGDGWGEINGYKFPESLIDALLAKQRPDGSWANPVDLVRENDPVVATAYALSALAECRKAIK